MSGLVWRREESPFLRPDDVRLQEVLTDAAVHLLTIDGADRFSIRGMARVLRVTPPTLLERHSRSQIVEMVCETFARRWVMWSRSEHDWWSSSGSPLRLPSDQSEARGVRVRAALSELARGEALRGNPLPADRLGRIVVEERTLLEGRVVGIEAVVPSDEVIALVALIDGLRAELAAAKPLIELHGAQLQVGRHVREMLARARRSA